MKTFETHFQPGMWQIFCLLAVSHFSEANLPKCCPNGQSVDLVKKECSQTDFARSDSTLGLIPTSSSLSEGEFSTLCEEEEDPQPVPIHPGKLLSSNLSPGQQCIDLARQENGSLTLVAWTRPSSPPRCRHSACLEKCCPLDQVFGQDNKCRDVPDQGMLWTADKVLEVTNGAVVRRSDIVTR